MGVLPKLFKLWPWADLDPFYAMVKFGHIGFCMRKSENYYFFGNYCSLGSQSCMKHLAKWVNEVEWVSKVKVILWPWSKVTQISKLKLVFHTCHKLWAENCEIRQTFKWDLIKLCETFIIIAFKLPKCILLPLFSFNKLLTDTIKCDLYLLFHKISYKFI